jgi:hypothetical protein
VLYGKDEDFLLGLMVGNETLRRWSCVVCKRCEWLWCAALAPETRLQKHSMVPCPLVGIVSEETKRPPDVDHHPQLASTPYRTSPHDIATRRCFLLFLLHVSTHPHRIHCVVFPPFQQVHGAPRGVASQFPKISKPKRVSRRLVCFCPEQLLLRADSVDIAIDHDRPRSEKLPNFPILLCFGCVCSMHTFIARRATCSIGGWPSLGVWRCLLGRANVVWRVLCWYDILGL